MTIRTEARSAALTKSERDVLELLASGLSNQAIAARLFVSPRTVEGRLASIYMKWDLGDRAEMNNRVLAAVRFLFER